MGHSCKTLLLDICATLWDTVGHSCRTLLSSILVWDTLVVRSSGKPPLILLTGDTPRLRHHTLAGNYQTIPQLDWTGCFRSLPAMSVQHGDLIMSYNSTDIVWPRDPRILLQMTAHSSNDHFVSREFCLLSRVQASGKPTKHRIYGANHIVLV